MELKTDDTEKAKPSTNFFEQVYNPYGTLVMEPDCDIETLEYNLFPLPRKWVENFSVTSTKTPK